MKDLKVLKSTFMWNNDLTEEQMIKPKTTYCRINLNPEPIYASYQYPDNSIIHDNEYKPCNERESDFNKYKEYEPINVDDIDKSDYYVYKVDGLHDITNGTKEEYAIVSYIGSGYSVLGSVLIDNIQNNNDGYKWVWHPDSVPPIKPGEKLVCSID